MAIDSQPSNRRQGSPRKDLALLRRALRLAERGRYRVAPNPMVGAVLVHEGRVVGEGWHREVGGPHAEVEALAAAGAAASGATMHVTLEPCNHHGRTPPCVDALLAAGVARVVVAHRDPDPRTAGQGIARLRAAGIEVVLATELGPAGVDLARDAALLNLRFLAPHVLGRPAVTLKWAMSLDGKIATVAGESRWISSPAGRRAGLALREEHDAILVGSGTVLADDPRLDRRLGLAVGPILRVVVDRRLRCGAEMQMLRVPGPVLVVTTEAAVVATPARRDALVAAGAEVVALPVADPPAVVALLGARGVRNVLVEGGGEIAAAFVDANLYDRVSVDLAPRLLGGRTAPSPLGGAGIAALAQAPLLAPPRLRRAGGDLVLETHSRVAVEELVTAVTRSSPSSISPTGE